MSTRGAAAPEVTAANGSRLLLNKVPEVTIWFWIIKILCTTVGESFADWVSVDLHVGLIDTSLLFTVVLAAVLAWQLRCRRYHPFPYWLTVVALSVTGTLYTDILTDRFHVSLALTTPVCAALLAVVFATWWARERTLSIHSIVTREREAFYWLAILVTFALGTAAGDWSLELTGWGPGVSVLLPALLIVAVVVGWRLGAEPVLSFWMAYVLTRPLGANLGDWLSAPRELGGQDLGTAVTSTIFLTAILLTVVYLVIRRPDAIERPTAGGSRPARERAMLAYYAAVAVVAVVVVAVANSRPHASFSAEEEALSRPVAHLTPAEATARFPRADVGRFRSIVRDTMVLVDRGEQARARARITDLEMAWDQDQRRLQPRDTTAWGFLDHEIDLAIGALRAKRPDVANERSALRVLLASLSA